MEEKPRSNPSSTSVVRITVSADLAKQASTALVTQLVPAKVSSKPISNKGAAASGGGKQVGRRKLTNLQKVETMQKASTSEQWTDKVGKVHYLVVTKKIGGIEVTTEAQASADIYLRCNTPGCANFTLKAQLGKLNVMTKHQRAVHPKSKIEGSLKSLGGGDWFGAAAAVGVIAKKALEESERDYSEVCAVLEGLITKIEVGSSSTYVYT